MNKILGIPGGFAVSNLIYRLLRVLNWPERPALTLGNRQETRLASLELVTPFTGFILSHFYLSKEIELCGLTWLNPSARRISKRLATRIEHGDIIYCQVDQLPEFVQHILPRIRARFVLITGKWQLPALSDGDYIDQILKSPELICWFSQNQTLPRKNIRAFPYGIHLENAPAVARRAACSNRIQKELTVFVPYASVHAHLDQSTKAVRRGLTPYMSSREPTSDYLEKVAASYFVISPPGDRVDTYRHWEIIALGSIPVCRESVPLRLLLGSAALYCDDFSDFIRRQPQDFVCNPNPNLATVEYWKQAIFSEIASSSPQLQAHSDS